ncbi:MAG: hypothetical protein JW904_13820 [Spirochaetales bacterium]|nr:hypothetical protein [Spirochaetales bacterium]
MKMMNRKIYIFFYFLIVCLAAHGDDFSFSGDRVTSVFSKGKERTLLSGHAVIKSENNHITADEIELYGKNSSFALCRGNVRFINAERGMELTCEKLYYDREKKVVRVQGNAIMADRKNEVIVKGGFIEHRETEDISLIQIGVRILKDEMVCRSEFAKYIRENDMLELSGMPVVFWKGDEYKASKIIIDLKKDEVKLEGNVEGQIITESDTPEPKKPSVVPEALEPVNPSKKDELDEEDGAGE